MSLWKRGKVYWSYIYVDGIRYSQSTGTGNLRQATTIETQFRDELNRKRHQIIEPHPEMTFGALAARFLAEGAARPWHLGRLTLLLPYWEQVPIGRIYKGMADDYRRRRHAKKKVTDLTINRDLQALRRMLFWAVDEGLLPTNPLSRLRLVPERRKPRSIPSLEDERRLIEAAAPHLESLIIAAVDTGMRRGELLTQRWEHVDFNRRLLQVTHSKTAGGEGREIPFTGRVCDLLFGMRQNDGLIFTFKSAEIKRVKTAWHTAIHRAGIRYFRFHDLRHTFNTRLMEAGVMQDIRKALMGHSSGEDVNAIYTHVELPAKRKAIQQLEAWIATQHQQPNTEGARDEKSETNGNRNAATGGRTDRAEAVEEKDAGRGRPGSD